VTTNLGVCLSRQSWEFPEIGPDLRPNVGRQFGAVSTEGTIPFELMGAIEPPLPHGVEFCTESPSDTGFELGLLRC
jgi:hypothetical protein